MGTDRTCVNELRDVSVGREEQDDVCSVQQDDVVEWNGADEVQQEPRLDVVDGDLPRLEDDLVGEIVRDDTCTTTTTTSSSSNA